MSLAPVTFQSKPISFKNGGQQVQVPANLTARDLVAGNATFLQGKKEVVQQPQTQPVDKFAAQSSVQPYKPNWKARIAAGFVSFTETTKGAISGLLYGTAVGAPAAIMASILTRGGEAAKNTRLGKIIFGTAVVAGTLAGGFVGKQKVSDSIKGAGVGLLYGATGGAAATGTAMVMNSLAKNGKKLPMGKGVFAAAAIMNTLIGAYIGKLHGNKRAGDMHDMWGDRVGWTMGRHNK
jgi:hypothetical protein